MANVRFEAAGALMHLANSPELQMELASLCLTRVCTLINESDLEAEIMSMLNLAGVLAVDLPANQVHIAHTGLLPRILQLMQHPHAGVCELATRLMGTVAEAESNRYRFDRMVMQIGRAHV